MTEARALWLPLTEYVERLAVPDAREPFSALGPHPLVFVSVDDSGPTLPRPPVTTAAVIIGVDRSGVAPAGFDDAFDVLLTTNEEPSAPWVGMPAARLDETLTALAGRMAESRLAAAVLAQVLRAGEGLAFEQALLLESFAYSTLIGGKESRAWLSRQKPRAARAARPGVVRLDRQGDELQVVLGRPEVHNAFGTRMRDELIEALQVPLLDPSIRSIVLSGEGPSFCSGGDLHEFGTAPDAATAHAVRLQQSAALLVHRLASRVSVHVQGACIGAGIEISAAASHIHARPDAYFRLPEVAMGLIPGAGGTVSIPRRIGRHRACFMALTGATIDSQTARRWGLVDALDH